MVWLAGGGYRLAPALLTLLDQLQAEYPGGQWLNSPQTGTVGDLAHQAEASSSDHNPWLDRTVRALDVAADVSGVPGIVTVTDAPDCEALFAMVNRLYAARDPRVWPNGYAIYRRRITDWNRPGSFRAHTGDPHLYHLHISTSQDPAGYNSMAPWPIPAAGSGSPAQEDDMANYTDWPAKDRQALANDVATALVRRPMGGVDYPGNFAQMLKATLDAARLSAAANIPAEIRAALSELPAGSPVDVNELAEAIMEKIGTKLSDTTP